MKAMAAGLNTWLKLFLHINSRDVLSSGPKDGLNSYVFHSDCKGGSVSVGIFHLGLLNAPLDGCVCSSNGTLRRVALGEVPSLASKATKFPVVVMEEITLGVRLKGNEGPHISLEHGGD